MPNHVKKGMGFNGGGGGGTGFVEPNVAVEAKDVSVLVKDESTQKIINQLLNGLASVIFFILSETVKRKDYLFSGGGGGGATGFVEPNVAVEAKDVSLLVKDESTQKIINQLGYRYLSSKWKPISGLKKYLTDYHLDALGIAQRLALLMCSIVKDDEYQETRRGHRSRRSHSPRPNLSVFSRIRRERSRSPRKNSKKKEGGVFKRLGGRGRTVSACFDSRNQFSHLKYTEALSESEDSKGWHWKSKSREKRSSREEDDLS
ncbi:hypothetical protein Tco_0583332 [Tanacetum coccineum]